MVCFQRNFNINPSFNMQQADTIQRFIFDQKDIRGEVVHLNKSYQEAVDGHDYPPIIRSLMADALVSVTLLSATLKFKGRLSIQLQGGDIISLLLVQITHDQKIRATIKWDGETENKTLLELIKNANLVITIEPEEGKRYQGIVPLEGDRFNQFIEKYFEQSEQLPTRIWLASNQQHAAGLLLQRLPEKENQDRSKAEHWEHFTILTDTLKNTELLNLPNNDLLYRLYHGETVKIFDEQAVQYVCGCSKEKCENAIISLGSQEIEAIKQEEEFIEIKCDFCNNTYRFDIVDLSRLEKISAEKFQEHS